ncbi:hypothetical protein GYMLUDRAFT_50683 [Collybiopsis luxurians FD-317 M1]|uniref:Uncharacterized protein n=1 Tax=Collybiopsis luxurians FD-317 M1 TaxID=944289 RepID=A0A0D0C0U5_9AGAR|nr:hypothetical protein GYMLUDRAFT_50683 [Collybiopsis luxurians FD-317 M1]
MNYHYSDSRPQWDSYYPPTNPQSVFQTWQVSGYPGQSSQGGPIVPYSSPHSSQSLRDPFQSDYFPPGHSIDVPATSSSPPLRLEFLPRRRGHTGKPPTSPITFGVGAVPGVPIWEMFQSPFAVDDGHTNVFRDLGVTHKAVHWDFDYPGLPSETHKIWITTQEGDMTRSQLAYKICKELCKIFHEAEMRLGQSSGVEIRWSLRAGRWRRLRLLSLVRYPSTQPTTPQKWVPIFAEVQTMRSE